MSTVFLLFLLPLFLLLLLFLLLFYLLLLLIVLQYCFDVITIQVGKQL